MRYNKAVAVAVAALAVTAMAAPAQAQRWGGGRHHRSHDGISTGDAILGVLLVGGLVAAASHERRERERAVEPVYEPTPEPVERYQPAETPAPDSARFDGLYDEEAAADRCATEAEMEGTRYARLARVTGISATTWNGASWTVRGRMEFADSYRDSARIGHDFSCRLKKGGQPSVEIAGLTGQ